MNDPSKTSPLYDGMAAKWSLPQTLMGGTLAMQAAGTKFLPRHPAENSAIYAERASRSVLRNYFRRTVQKLVGRVFAEPLIISDDMPDEIVAILRNIDLVGRGLNVFARDWFEDNSFYGCMFINGRRVAGRGTRERRPALCCACPCGPVDRGAMG